MSGTVTPGGTHDAVRPAGPAAPDAHRRGERRLLTALGLLAVAVASGFAWWLIRYQPAPEPVPVAAPPAQTTTTTTAPPTSTSPKLSSGGFEFTAAVTPVSSKDCAAVSFGDLTEWFEENPCTRVVRGLYTTSKKYARALVSIVVVTMPDEQRAAVLKSLVDTTGTGNVNDMLRDGTVRVSDAPDLATGSYDSTLAGREVTVVQVEFFDDYNNKKLLAEITREAMRVATQRL